MIALPRDSNGIAAISVFERFAVPEPGRMPSPTLPRPDHARNRAHRPQALRLRIEVKIQSMYIESCLPLCPRGALTRKLTGRRSKLRT